MDSDTQGIIRDENGRYVKGSISWPKGKRHTEETKRKISKNRPDRFGENHPMYGKHLSDKTKQLLSEINKGKTLSEEHKQKISESNKGRKVSEETRKKIGAANKGNIPWSKGRTGVYSDEMLKRMSESQKKVIHSKERIEKSANANRGKKRSPEICKKMSERHKGEGNPSWKGGISFEPYCNKFNNKFKESIRNKFNRTCFLCGKTETEVMKSHKDKGKQQYRLSIHHVKYQKDCLCNDKKCEFVPLCLNCHLQTNGNRKYWELKITNKLKNEKCI